MKTYDFHYSVHEVDGKDFELIECSTWPRLNVQVIHTTPERFEDDLKVIKPKSVIRKFRFHFVRKHKIYSNYNE